jgi:hypothetical protein
MSKPTKIISVIVCLLLIGELSIIAYQRYSAIKRDTPPQEAPPFEEHPLATEATLLQRGSSPGSPDCALQSDREAFLRKLEMEGLLQKWDHSENVCRLFVSAQFHTQTFDLKQRLAGVAFAWAKCDDAAVDLVVLYDSETEKTVGHYGMKYGGLKME